MNPRFERTMVRLLTGLPPAALRALARPPKGATTPVDPHVRMMLALRRARGYPGLSVETPELTRTFMRAQAALARAVPTAVTQVTDLTVTGAAGELPARHYANPDNEGLLLFLHGGGFVAGDLDTHDEPCRVLCATAGVNVLSVEYRLAPEHPFPAAVEDVAAAYRWTVEHADELGGGPIAVGGDSSGANLATVLCQLIVAGECDAPPPAAQLLFYPPTRHDPQWPSRSSYADGFLLTRADIDFFQGHYAAGDEPDFRHSPLLGAARGPLPPVVLYTAEFDPLRDEGEAYAEALRAAGTDVAAVRVDGMVRGFVNLTTLSPAARTAVVDAGRRLATLLNIREESMSPLRNRVVFITGAARGIGAETARRLAARGARVALAGLEPELLEKLAAELGADRHAWFECDVTDQAGVEAAVAGTIERFGRIDVVVANAGIANRGTVAVTPVDDVARTIEVNLLGVVRTVGTALPHVIESRGYCLLVASAAAFSAAPGMAAYTASKAGVEQFGNALRLEVAHKKVGVGVAYMSWIDTDLVRDVQADIPTFTDSIKKMPGPLRRVMPVGDCADAFVDAIEHRRDQVYVPKSLKRLRTLRGALAGPFDRIMRREAANSVPEAEENYARLGRSFGEHSMGHGKKAEKD